MGMNKYTHDNSYGVNEGAHICIVKGAVHRGADISHGRPNIQ